MKTDNRQSVASFASNVLNFLLQFIGVAAFYWLLLYSTINYWLGRFVLKMAKLNYEAGPNFTRELYFILLIFAIFCYLANRFVLNLYHTRTAKQLLVSVTVDYLIWPLQLFIMLEYNNWHITSILKDVSTLCNVFVLTALVIIKNVIAVKLLSGKKSSKEKISYKTR